MSLTPKRQQSPDDASGSIDRGPTKKRPRKRLVNDPTHAGSKIRTTSVRVKTNTGHVSVRKTKSVLHGPRPDATPATTDVAPLEGHLQNSLFVSLNLDDDQGVPDVPEDNVPKKRARKNTTTSKLQEWLELRDSTLNEIIRLEGLGDALGTTTCSMCESTDQRYRCIDCFGRCGLQCQSCLLKLHTAHPFHRIQEWNGRYFNRVSLKDLGQRYQLGHGGFSCPCPKAGPLNFVIFHTSGVFSINVDFCDCVSPPAPPRRVQLLRAGWFPATSDRPQTAFTFDILNMFHKLTLQGKTTAYDYYHSILNLSDNLQLAKSTHRYSEFNHVFRIWRHIKSAKYAGRGHDPGGVDNTGEGELVVECPACPHPGKNLPDDWEQFPPELQFLFTLFLAIDANFKLKNKDRGIKDFELDPGLGCYVEHSRYQSHLASHTDQHEINSCSSDHTAIARANTAVPGYTVNGMALGICSRHALVRPNGAVDLPKGEKFCSVDYMVLSALVSMTLARVVISYDIGCQWLKNFPRRMSDYPEMMQLPSDTQLEIGIPSWHVNGHGPYCQNNYSLNYIPGVGRTCGEDIELIWSHTNSLAPSIREMGPASRRETLNDHWNGWNFRKIIGFRQLFAKRFKDAVAMRAKHQDAFQTFSSTFTPSVIAKWSRMVEEWEIDRTKPNPYEEPVNRTTLQEVRLELAEEEALEANKGVIPLHTTSITVFLMKGLELEEQQHKLRYEASLITGNKSSKQHADLQEKRNGLSRRITQWREVQLVYMPMVASLLLETGTISLGTSDTSVGSELAEAIPLHLPSSLPSSLRNSSSQSSLAEKEYRLRIGQADEGLEHIRHGRRMITGLIQFKKFNISGAGNKPNTRFRTIVNRLQNRIQRAADVYRTAYNALLILQPDGDWKIRFRSLQPNDIRGPGRQADDPLQQSHSRYEMSWIWLVGKGSGSVGSGEGELDESLRAEWAKMKARQDRWDEEYKLVQEEMRRTVVYLEWKARWWRQQAARRSVEDESISQGLYACAERQAHQLDMLASSCVKKWVPLLKENGANVLWAGQYQVIEDEERSEDEDSSGDESEEGNGGKGKERDNLGEDIFDSFELDD